jgi:sialidase-1
MRLQKIALLFFSVFSFTFSQQNKIQVFISGEDGYNTYRIPAIIDLPNGELLAFCEGRVNNAGDFGNVDIVMKRSKDKGKTWNAFKIIVDYDSLQAGNPSPVIDLTDTQFPQGRIFLFYNTGNNTESEVRKGEGLREVWYKTSTDGGNSWSNAVNITIQVHKPNQPQINSKYNFVENWRSYANAPGHALQLITGKFKGRIFVPANHSSGNPLPHFKDYSAHGFYTDDHGITFHLSKNVNYPGSNESTSAELSGGWLMMNSRNQSGDIKTRIVSISNDGGKSWMKTYFDSNLPDPVCQGSILTIGKNKEKNILAFCNPADTTRRNNLTLRISYDEGKTWTKNFIVDKNDSDNNYSAYSDIVNLSPEEIGILYERNDYSEIIFTSMIWEE